DGNDVLRGNGGGDDLAGGDNEDVLQGGAGDDLLTGGLGADRFEFFGLFELDRIADFDLNLDVIAFDISSIGLNDFGQLQPFISQDLNGDAIIEISAGTDVITLTGIDPGDLQVQHFTFF
ncbi:MAG: calcium-binding protein, partial [Alphaproteobacteria bacterium]